MISGTVVIADKAITFTNTNNDRITYTVSDTINGDWETKIVPAKEFMIALGLALSWTGKIPGKEGYKMAESVQPDNPDLRFIPIEYRLSPEFQLGIDY